MNNSQFTDSQIRRASFLKNEQLYKKEGWKKAVFLKRSLDDYENHFLAALIDVNFCLLPVYLWALEFILILAGVIPPRFFDLLFYLMYGLLFVMSCVVLPLYTAANKGYSFGGRILGLRLVRNNRRPAALSSLVLRQLCGFGIPMMLFGYFFSVFGLIGWWMVNGLVTLISPKQKTIFDWVFSLADVYTPQYDLRLQDQTTKELEEAPVQPVKPALPKEEPEPAPGSVIDLHVRSSYSDDGSYDVEELFQQAVRKGMEVISITDHNNARANAQAVRFADLYNLRYIPGVEIDAELYGERVRILGYYIDWNDPVFDEIERTSLRREKNSSLDRVRAFEKALNLEVDADSILEKSRFKVVFPKDLTDLVFDHEQARKLPQVQQFLQDGKTEQESRQAFMDHYFGSGGECEVKVRYPDALKIVDAIHHAGGMAVLSGWRTGKISDDVLEGLLEGGIDGLEIFSPDVDDRQKAFLLTIADQEKLFVTAGSDYHGDWKPDRRMGETTASSKGEQIVRIFTRALDEEKPVS